MESRTLLFEEDGPIVAHVRVDEPADKHWLWIFTGRKEAEKFLATLPPREAEAFSKLIPKLRERRDSTSLALEGEVAALYISLLDVFHQNQTSGVIELQTRSHFVALDPPREKPPGDSILMWFNLVDGSYHIMIARSKSQAEQQIRSLPSLAGKRSGHLKQVQKWNTPKNSSVKPLYIGGPIAKLLSKGTMRLYAIRQKQRNLH